MIPDLLVLASSVLLALLACPPAGLWPAALVMLVPLVVLVERSTPARSFALGWLWLAGFGLVTMRWLVLALTLEYEVPEAAAWSFSALVAAAYALAPGAALLVYRGLRPRCRDALAPALFAALWTLGLKRRMTSKVIRAARRPLKTTSRAPRRACRTYKTTCASGCRPARSCDREAGRARRNPVSWRWRPRFPCR